MSTFYVAATPIGNLEDISFRAVRILGEVDVIAAEDTRQTLKLLNKYDISPSRLISCRARNEKESAPGIVNLLNQGKNVAYVSDAGTPGISDPGQLLVRTVREAGHTISPLPGPSAVTTLLSVSGMEGRGFLFEGFLSPKKSKRRTRLKYLLDGGIAFVFYESPHRIVSVLQAIAELDPNCNIFIGRELTKIFEEFTMGTPAEVLEFLTLKNSIKGEFTILVTQRKNAIFS